MSEIINKYENYFPQGLAEGQAFCNRLSERKRLATNIRATQHTLLMAPRRYGKTSLVNYVANEIDLPFSEVDLFVAIDAERIEQQILKGVKDIIATISSSVQNAVKLLSDYFKNYSSSWSIGTQGVQLMLQPDKNNDPATNIKEALEALENILAKKKQKAVLFLDEIQEIGEVAEGKGIEGAIRHVAQKTKYLSLVFSGSNRHLLQSMFYDDSRPLYKLCDRIILSRIATEEYRKHLNGLAIVRWQAALSEEALNKIFELTECHPYYMNTLCSKLWLTLNKAPTVEEVEAAWQQLVLECDSEMSKELSVINKNQRRILIEIASGTSHKLTSKEMLERLSLNSSTITQALQALEAKDYIEQTADAGYQLIDPLFKYSLIRHYINQSE